VGTGHRAGSLRRRSWWTAGGLELSSGAFRRAARTDRHHRVGRNAHRRGGASGRRHAPTAMLATGVLAVAVTSALWWSYFRHAREALEHALVACQGSVRSRLARDAFSVLHFPMLCGVIDTATKGAGRVSAWPPTRRASTRQHQAHLGRHEGAPWLQEPQRLVRSTIATRIEQPIVRWTNREHRKRDDCENEHCRPQPQGPATLRTANDSEEAGNHRERRLHEGCAFLARRPLGDGGLDAARQARRMFNSRAQPVGHTSAASPVIPVGTELPRRTQWGTRWPRQTPPT
jgi:Bacterial low temperature requirement A protein (LtrA)